MLIFMADYTLLGAAAALIYPEDFLRSYTALTIHGFVWHGILLFISLTIILSDAGDSSEGDFISSTVIFCILSLAALAINIAAEPLMQASHTEHSYAAMFYLNPYHLSPQPLVSAVQQQLGIPAGLILYSLCIIAAAAIVEIIRNKCRKLTKR